MVCTLTTYFVDDSAKRHAIRHANVTQYDMQTSRNTTCNLIYARESYYNKAVFGAVLLLSKRLIACGMSLW